jgi:ABC-type transport system involved in cytochrome bd biosynthesis fused ATPase/permease subunit
MADVLAAADGRSVLLITHRTEGLDDMDDVLVLSRGRLRSRNTHPRDNGAVSLANGAVSPGLGDASRGTTPFE